MGTLIWQYVETLEQEKVGWMVRFWYTTLLIKGDGKPKVTLTRS